MSVWSLMLGWATALDRVDHGSSNGWRFVFGINIIKSDDKVNPHPKELKNDIVERRVK
jgi:hypothetical protein